MITHTTDLQRFREGEDPAGQAQVWLDAGRIAARQGDVEAARRLLHSAVQADPGCVDAWLRLAWLAPSPDERRAYLRRVLSLEPGHARARAELARLEQAAGDLPSDALCLAGTGPAAALPAPASAPPVPSEGSGLPSVSSRSIASAPQAPALPPAAASRPKARRSGVGIAASPRGAAAPERGSFARRRTLAVLLLLALAFLAAVLIWGPVGNSVAWLLPTPTPAPTPVPTRTPREIAGAFVPQLQAAIDQASWARALEIVDIMLSLDPEGAEVQRWQVRTHLRYGQALLAAGDPEAAIAHLDRAAALDPADAEVQHAAMLAHLSRAQGLVEAGDPAAAVAHLDRAVALDPADADAQLWQQVTQAYLAGKAAVAAGNWDAAIDKLAHGVQERIPDYVDTTTLLTRASRERGIARQAAGQLKPARADLEAALALQPGDTEARAHLDQVMLELFPPKRIEIDIGDQRFYAWQGDTLVYNFPTSTGLPGRDTAPGHFKVLDKIPMAYSSIWRLQMPYWLGIYYVGGIENGIHALPIRPDGTVMWGGLLGTPQSYGCVILSTEAAALIFEWADVGTPVDIHY